MATATRTVSETLRVREAGFARARPASTRRRTRRLARLAELLEARTPRSSRRTQSDLADERAAALTPSLRDRLTLSTDRVAAMAEGVRAVAALEDPIGELIEERRLANGLELRKVRVPLGVVGVIYEARPNVTVDCAALMLKSGNATVLRGSSYAARSNAALAALVGEAVGRRASPRDPWSSSTVRTAPSSTSWQARKGSLT